MFKRYMHIERLGSDEVDGLLVGTVIVQPKIDGTNVSAWEEDGYIRIASRNQLITPENEHMGFNDWAHSTTGKLLLTRLWREHPTWRLYGEWLTPHSLKTYRDEAWRRFYVFDVLDDATDRFVPYTEYQPVLEQAGFDYIPIMATVANANEDTLRALLERNTFLIRDGAGVGEGIVLKRYDFVNRYGRTVWAKIVRNEFKEKNLAAFGAPDVVCIPDEVRFVQAYVTRPRVEKAIAAMQPWTSRRIPELFGRVYHELVTTELWDFLKTRKNKAKLDFSDLHHHMIAQIKAVYPELF